MNRETESWSKLENARLAAFKMAASLCIGALILPALSMAADASPSPVTFNKDVLPVLQKKCQSCHRPGQMGPMSLLNYKEARPWAKAMKEAVGLRKMPPWFADPKYGHFTNDPSLKPSEIDTIVKWADTEATEGDPKDAPSPVKWPEGWLIQPDIIVPGSAFDVPARPKNDVIEWMEVIVPSGFKADTWITSIQIKPTYPGVVHHICLAFTPHSPDIKYHVPQWQDKERDEDGSAIPGKGPTFGGSGRKPRPQGGMGADCYVPGNIAADYRDFQAAKLVPAGSDIILNLHYTPNGTAVRDEVQLGFTLLKEPSKRRYVSISTSAPNDPKLFAIPPHDPNWKSPPVEISFNKDAELVFMLPHMHARGKDMTYTLEYPDGRKEILLHVPRYDFNWQLGYHTSVKVPKGSKLHVDAHFDNSRNNKFNPNPDRTVYYGEMTWEEMMFPFLGVVVDLNVEPSAIVTKNSDRSSPSPR